MKITFINSPLQDYGKVEKRDYYTTPPLGLGYLATIAKNMGCDVKLLDAEALGLSPKEIVEQTEANNPDVVGINLISPTLNLSKQIIQQLKVPKIIAGGSHATINPQQTLIEIPKIDILAVGEAELTLEELVKNNFNPNSVKGIYYRKNNQIIPNQERK